MYTQKVQHTTSDDRAHRKRRTQKEAHTAQLSMIIVQSLAGKRLLEQHHSAFGMRKAKRGDTGNRIGPEEGKGEEER